MDRRRHYGRKIKKTKNLYRRKKTAGQKAFGTVILIIALSAIAFLGFCIGKPLLDYLGNMDKDQPTAWMPEASYKESHDAPLEQDSDVSAATSDAFADGQDVIQTTDAREPIGTNQPHSTTAGTDIALAPTEIGTLVCFEAPSGALSNRASLASVLAKAKSGGYNAVVVQLKDRNGFLHYRSTIERVSDTEVEAGTMTLSEIMSVFSENGIVPVAEISVLSDNKGCELFPDMSYKCIDSPATSWLEWVEKKRWANPESDATREYFAEITTELSIAGFENILLTDVVYPEFQHYDAQYIAAAYFSPDRYKLLYNVIKAGSIIEMKASDVIGESFGRTAEPLSDISQFHDNSVALVIARNDLPTDAGYPADAKALVETVLASAEKKVGGMKIIPVIDGSGFDDAEKTKIASSLGSLGYESYIMR